jgi:trehalose 6-phosphate synthase
MVSNRVANPSDLNMSGGLSVCILDALRSRGGIWFGWNGDLVAKETEIGISSQTVQNVTFVTMPLTKADYREYYLGFANSALWPVHHNRLDLARFTLESRVGYRRVNERYAKLLTPLLKATDLVWVHDFHLIPLGVELRARAVNNNIGFFFHIPFPSQDILGTMPEHEWLMNALLEYDVVGFQTRSDHANFCRVACDILGGVMLSDDKLRVGERTLTVSVFPVGIDVNVFRSMATSPDANQCIRRLRRRGEPRVNMIGVDRLDYTKGLQERFKAFRNLLERYPENRKAVTLLQIAPPCRQEVRAYIDIRHDLETLSGQINGEFGDFDWTPVRYVHRNVPRDTLAALYRGSQVGVVTPLRDGMNLVAKEYVAAQDDADPGVLVLSKFAGAAEELEAALIVNPYDSEEMAYAMQRGLSMRREERKERHSALIKRIYEHDAHNWMNEFLRTLSPQSIRQAA